ncbi:hypothetical protein A2961_01305 [Candidatus Woesebacteria bacterium RIFCSPLOWO2_01_FULL_39_21]|uniref:DUF1616 domain-containing protein n=1 Tax=Candidatus Woesebacteria bacterium RIFCSPLOWO2_01_FULL_39_21 TaxID=1802519 RepID=A0A1F8BHL5_9BACT|nr:MAG: hypothetical protein A2691_03720 [Candidatus Woesebacteria bacterium RIFCSPHIGHO2_01_FULL_39_23]OGM63159.1 MAG: hypothetical protein A2961_01305 [Candidatus Woesebacteria bacterium RIFCSPLOWO2_01_FULL_39_21]
MGFRDLKTSINRPNLAGISKTIVILFVILVGALLSIKATKEILIPNLKRQREPLTELYFSNHLNIPKQIEKGKPYSFEFTTRNLEYKDTNYVYEILVSENEGMSLIEKGEFILTHGETKSVPEEFLIPESFGRAKITVSLVNKDQEISFWIEEDI